MGGRGERMFVSKGDHADKVSQEKKLSGAILFQLCFMNADFSYGCKFLLQKGIFSELLLCLQFLRIASSKYIKEVYFGVAYSSLL